MKSSKNWPRTEMSDPSKESQVSLGFLNLLGGGVKRGGVKLLLGCRISRLKTGICSGVDEAEWICTELHLQQVEVKKTKA